MCLYFLLSGCVSVQFSLPMCVTSWDDDRRITSGVDCFLCDSIWPVAITFFDVSFGLSPICSHFRVVNSAQRTTWGERNPTSTHDGFGHGPRPVKCLRISTQALARGEGSGRGEDSTDTRWRKIIDGRRSNHRTIWMRVSRLICSDLLRPKIRLLNNGVGFLTSFTQD